MRLTTCFAAALVLGAASAPLAAKGAQFQLHNTTWTFFDPVAKMKARESIDASGNYITQSIAGKHLDHGTAAMKDGKACFTSAMTKDGELCWTVRPVAVGHSIVAVNGKGEKLKVLRVKYRAMSMPK